jgi:hypothetical protein
MFYLWGVLFHLLLGRMEISAGSLVSSTAPASWDLLQFLDGSTLHGKLRSMLNGNGVRWEHPDARQPIDFKLSNLAWIRFENPKPVAPEIKPTCRFRFNNGDETGAVAVAGFNEILNPAEVTARQRQIQSPLPLGAAFIVTGPAKAGEREEDAEELAIP